MAYINRETSAKIRKALKESFPEIKFSVSIRHHMALSVCVMASPYFEDGAAFRVNTYWMDKHFEGQQLAVLKKIEQIIQEVGEWYDNSDAMSDYFNTAFYYDITVGNWDKAHVNTAQETAA